MVQVHRRRGCCCWAEKRREDGPTGFEGEGAEEEDVVGDGGLDERDLRRVERFGD